MSFTIPGIMIVTPKDINQIFPEIELGIESSFPNIAKDIAVGIGETAKTLGEAKFKHSGGKWSKSIKVLPNDIRKGFARYDVVADVSYWMWLEYGKNAGIGLPYSQTGSRDFSKSLFEGYHMFEEAANFVTDNDIISKVAVKYMISGLASQFKASIGNAP